MKELLIFLGVIWYIAFVFFIKGFSFRAIIIYEWKYMMSRLGCPDASVGSGEGMNGQGT